VAIPDLPTTTTINPAILVNGDLDIAGNTKVVGSQGNVHANGDIAGNGGSYEISGNMTATGELTGDIHATGLTAGGNAPDSGSRNQGLGLHGTRHSQTDGRRRDARIGRRGRLGGVHPPRQDAKRRRLPGTAGPTQPRRIRGARQDQCPRQVWPSRTYWVEGNVAMKGTGKSTLTQLSILAEGNLALEGNGQFKPGNNSGIQFVTNGDFNLSGTVDADDTFDFDGQILVREQMSISGNSEFQGRVMVEDRQHAANVYDAATNPNGNRGANALSSNGLSGNMKVTYNGSLGGITVTIPGGPDTYTNTVSGWIEQ
jgi:hypothetical protein